MRLGKRPLVFGIEFGVLVFGFILSVLLAAAPARFFQVDSWIGALFLAGLVLTVTGFIEVRRKVRPWKTVYEAEGRELEWAVRKQHPARARRKRIAKGILAGVPSLIAALVLFYFPEATHLLRTSQDLGPYRVSIPWTLVVAPLPEFPGAASVLAYSVVGARGGPRLIPFWRTEVFASEMEFGAFGWRPDTAQHSAEHEQEKRARATHIVRKEFRLKDNSLTCWQYLSELPDPVNSGLWEIDCETESEVRGQYFRAWFRGVEADIPAFYKVIESVAPAR